MKFLCVPCDTPMKMISVAPPDRGSLSVVYGCSECGYEMAMLTNAFETQLVSSLGVKIGPDEPSKEAAKCPFAAMVAPQTEAAVGAGGLRWTAEASARMDTVPEFVRPMARTGIERFAEESGYREVNLAVLDEAKSRFGM